MIRLANAPRCFGLGSFFGADATICGVCAVHDDCLPLAKLSLTETNKVIGENNVALMHVSVKITEAKEVVEIIKADALPKECKLSTSKLSTLIRQMTSSNPCVVDYLNTGRNPFSVSTKPAYLKPLVDHMQRIDESDEGLVEFLVNVFEEKRVKAEQLVRLVKAAFKVLGYIKE